MSRLRTAGLVLGWGVALLWAARTIESLVGMQRLPDLNRRTPQRPKGKISVIVPARNEGAAVADGLRSLMGQRDVDVEVIAVDDRSTDETGRVMDSLVEEAASTPVRYHVEHITCLPKRWLGKPHAMARGVEQARGEWLLFTDADVVFAPEALTRALAYAEESGVDHLLLLPTAVATSAGEHMMLAFLHVLSIWGPRVWRVADPTTRDAVGVGAFNMLRRSTYDAVGGWERLRLEVIEDLRMGYLVKHSGFRSHVVAGRNLVRIRWAHGAWGVVENLTKNVFSAFRFNLGMMLGGTASTAVLFLLPFAGLALSPRDRRWLVPNGISLACVLALYQRHPFFTDRQGRQAKPGSIGNLLWAVTMPPATLLFLYAMLRSTVLTIARKGVLWRGTFYPLPELKANAGSLR